MKKYLILVFSIFQLLVVSAKNPPKAFAFKAYPVFPEKIFCDGCGSASGGSMGFASMLTSNFIGVRYFSQHYKSSDGLYSNSAWYNENFHTIQVWARIPVTKKFQVSAFIPYHFHDRETATGQQEIAGLGDITVLAMYRLYQTKKDSTLIKHSLQLGGGVKTPTGSFNQENAGAINPSFQVGTGSWDYLLAAEYTVRRKQFGLNTMLNYVFKTENQKNYRFGDQFNYAGTLYYLYEKKSFSIAPQLGVAGEAYGSNYQHGELVRKTSGDILFSKFGIEMGRKKFSLGANLMLPLNQSLSDGRVEAKNRWSVNLNYSL